MTAAQDMWTTDEMTLSEHELAAAQTALEHHDPTTRPPMQGATMTDNTVLISSVTITKLTVGNDVSIHVSTDPENLTISEILDMLAVAQYTTKIDNTPPFDQED